jgi:hypothetical protein
MTPESKRGSSARRPFAESKGLAIRVTLAILCCALLLSQWDPARIGAIVATIVAALAVGAGLGFLFGIPRSLATASNGREADPPPAGGHSSVSFSHNTNLEQISDWLTKIVVGVSLVQADALYQKFSVLSQAAATSWAIAGGAVTAGALLLASASTGFLGSYIWTRTTFMQLLVYSDRRVAEERRGRLEAENTVRDVVRAIGGGPALSRLEQPRREASKSFSVGAALKRMLPSDAAAGEGQIDKSADDLWRSDPNKGAFGGESVVGGRRLDADVVAVSRDGSISTLTLRVSAEPGHAPLRVPVTFHLHPTFNQPVVVVSPSEFGVAELRVLAAGAFTVGAVIEAEHISLELDLANKPDLPGRFRDV